MKSKSKKKEIETVSSLSELNDKLGSNFTETQMNGFASDYSKSLNNSGFPKDLINKMKEVYGDFNFVYRNGLTIYWVFKKKNKYYVGKISLSDFKKKGLNPLMHKYNKKLDGTTEKFNYERNNILLNKVAIPYFKLLSKSIKKSIGEKDGISPDKIYLSSFGSAKFPNIKAIFLVKNLNGILGSIPVSVHTKETKEEPDEVEEDKIVISVQLIEKNDGEIKGLISDLEGCDLKRIWEDNGYISTFPYKVLGDKIIVIRKENEFVLYFKPEKIRGKVNSKYVKLLFSNLYEGYSVEEILQNCYSDIMREENNVAILNKIVSRRRGETITVDDLITSLSLVEIALKDKTMKESKPYYLVVDDEKTSNYVLESDGGKYGVFMERILRFKYVSISNVKDSKKFGVIGK